jgi:multidrug efflux pump subunit AcrA (membrane-fusion protein)
VFVVDNGVVHTREVRCGLAANGFTEIMSGLREGEQVVTVGQLYLHDNDKVRVNAFAPWNQK